MAPRLVKNFLDKVKGKEKGPRDQPGDGQDVNRRPRRQLRSYEHAIGTSVGTGTGAMPGANTNAHAQANYQMMASGTPTNPGLVTQRKPVQTTTQLPHHPAAAAANAAATAAAVAAQQAIVSPSTPQAASQVSPLSPSAVSPQTPTVTARVTIPQGTSSNDAASMILSQIVASIVTAQNSCPIHEQCDSSCSGRIGVSQYRVLPSGERVDETDLRLQAATANAAAAAAAAATNTTASAPPVAEGPAAELHQPATITPSTPLFTYTPIENPKAEIRLLKIKPAYARADPLDLELGAADRKVLCNGSLFMARSSLEKALKRLRAGFAAGTREEYIWADAICIDQGNEEEKSHQIMLMRYIYSRAQTVYVDLGDIKGRSLNFGGVTMTWGGGGGMGQRDLLTEADSKKHPLYYKTAYLALTQPWFSRTWIIQEVTLAKRARFMFEGNVFERDDLDAVLDRRTLSEHPERMQELLSSQDTLYQQQQNDSLKMVQLTRDFAATEAKDKIYGLMALMPEYDQGAMGPYSQPLATLFRRFAALHVRYGRAVSMLDSAGIQRRRIHEYLPSWVPDWTAQSPSPKVISTLRPIRSPIHDPVATYRSALERWGRGSKTPLGGGRRMDAEETFQMQAMTACQDRSFAITRGGRVEAGFRLVGDGSQVAYPQPHHHPTRASKVERFAAEAISRGAGTLTNVKGVVTGLINATEFPTTELKPKGEAREVHAVSHHLAPFTVHDTGLPAPAPGARSCA
ncbi:unnamed protein product [Parascedosporium putredinis]|uniref:Heterokaryon incompatibility domain-containing protein n=1 Tax=Parascedosporium putredinis TaxID=1442378 RepID=A0A9P1H1J3_9PEZI|nr:unnamed protein product [Parascedosporium putredinis]CAI7992824.1 unnamed protein product [Parascedosporium putredinis]